MKKFEPKSRFESFWRSNLFYQGMVCLLLVLFLNGIGRIPQIGSFFLERYRQVLVYDAKDKIEPFFVNGWSKTKGFADNSWRIVSTWFTREVKEALAPPTHDRTLLLPVKGRPQFIVDRDESGVVRLGLLIPKGTDLYSSAAGVVREVAVCAGGWRIQLDHSGDWSTVYYPLSVPYVVQGQWVKGKELIGRTGLLDHRRINAAFFWEVSYKGVSVDPLELSGQEGFIH